MNTIKEKTPSIRKQTFINLASQVTFVILNFVVSIWIVSYLIKNLGVASYGLIPLAVSVANYFNISINAFHTSFNRFITMDLQNENFD